MADGQTCFTCRFSMPVKDQPEWLMCRRRAPVVIDQPSEGFRSVFPMIGTQDWCGEYETASEERRT